MAFALLTTALVPLLLTQSTTPCKNKAAGEFIPEAILDAHHKVTCAFIQGKGMFNTPNPAKCNQKMSNGGHPPSIMLAIGASKCCKSKEPDQTVCKADKCIFGLQKCLSLHDDFTAAEKNFTDPKAMEVVSKGLKKGER